MNPTNQLTIIAEESGLEKSQTEHLMTKFSGFFQEAKAIANESKTILVTEESDFGTMRVAREARLKLKEIRVNAEKVRKELKEQSLREGKAIDGMANIIKALIVPVEEHLEKQEKFAEFKESERLEKKYAERIEKLSHYVDDVTLYSLREMSDEAFEKLLANSKRAFELQKEAEVKAEAERVEAEKKQQLLRDRQMELSPYRMFIEMESKVIDRIVLDLNTTQGEFDILLERGKVAKQKDDEARASERAEAEKMRIQSEKDRKARESAELKLRQEKEAQATKEREARQQAERDQQAKDDEAKKALLAPDKMKLLQYIVDLQKVTAPALASREANLAMVRAVELLAQLCDTLRNDANKL